MVSKPILMGFVWSIVSLATGLLLEHPYMSSFLVEKFDTQNEGMC